MAIFRVVTHVPEAQLGSVVAALKRLRVKNIDFAMTGDDDELPTAPRAGKAAKSGKRKNMAYWVKLVGPMLKKGNVPHSQIIRETGIASSMLYAVRLKLKIPKRK